MRNQHGELLHALHALGRDLEAQAAAQRDRGARDRGRPRIVIDTCYQATVQLDTRERQATDLVAGVTKLEAERAARLVTTDEQRLITTPLLVRMLLIVHFNLRRLPDQRAELYMAMVDTLLTSDYHPDEAVALTVKSGSP